MIAPTAAAVAAAVGSLQWHQMSSAWGVGTAPGWRLSPRLAPGRWLALCYRPAGLSAAAAAVAAAGRVGAAFSSC